jgi:hypothetical protein
MTAPPPSNQTEADAAWRDRLWCGIGPSEDDLRHLYGPPSWRAER